MSSFIILHQTFLENGDILVDNNRAETSAILYSLISTAQANGIDAEKYLTELFSNLTGTIILPWKEKENNDT